MRKSLKLNTFSSLLFEITTISCGFIIPRLIIQYYGSNINGLVNSVAQFVGIVTFLDLGVGKVVQSALYKPLSMKDSTEVSKIVHSASKFFKRIAQIMIAYILVLIFIYPSISGQQYEWFFSALLIISIGISTFAQYYIGIVVRILLTADQKGYIHYFTETVALVLNALTSVILITMGMSIIAVKLSSSLIFLAKPIFLQWYVHRHYHLDRSITYYSEPIAQKWNGLAQHFSYVVLNNTDVVVLTVFSTFSDVSIYSVYNLVVFGVKRLFTSLTHGVEVLLGNLWAENNYYKLERTFEWAEWLIHTGVIFVFGCTQFLIVPFIQVYTKGVYDANYFQPLFGTLLVFAHGTHCLRLPYNIMIFAANHYKQTQISYIIAALINIIVSVITVRRWGLIGVALGTLIAMFFQTLWMAWYNTKYLIKRPIRHFVKQAAADALTIILYSLIPLNSTITLLSYTNWLLLAIKCAVFFIGVSFFVNIILYKSHVNALYRKLIKHRLEK